MRMMIKAVVRKVKRKSLSYKRFLLLTYNEGRKFYRCTISQSLDLTRQKECEQNPQMDSSACQKYLSGA